MSSDAKGRNGARQTHARIGIALGTALVLGSCGNRYADPITLDGGAAGRVGNTSQGGAPGRGGNAAQGGSPGGVGDATGAAGNHGLGGGPGGAVASGGGAGGVSPGTFSRVELAGSPLYTRLQRLTNAQWQRAALDILKLNAATSLSPGLPDPAAGVVTDFLNNEKRLFVDAQTEQGLETAAEAAAALVTGSADGLTRIYAGTDATGFVRTLGRRAFRRPLSADDEARYQAIFARGQELYGPTFASGAGLVIRAMLQSTPFLYRSELGLAGAPLDGYEMAAKLSFWLAGTTPSDQLLDVVAAGGLQTVDEIESTARELLERADAVAVMRDFHQQLYRLPVATGPFRLDVSPALGAELAAVSTRFFDGIFTGGQGLREVLTSTRYFVGPGLAPSYGLSPLPTAIEERQLDPSRVGYFMQVPFLLLNGVGDQPDSLGRGNAILQQLLCVDVPGHSFATSLPALTPGQTHRQRLEQYNSSGSCGNCHATAIDPLGFAFEGFDGLGRARTTDNGGVVVTSGSFPFQDGVLTFANAKELMTSMAAGTQAHTCYARKLVGYALQRDLVEGDRPLLDALAGVSRGHSLKELVVSLVRDPAFRTRAGGAP